jgi:hypothetical protein
MAPIAPKEKTMSAYRSPDVLVVVARQRQNEFQRQASQWRRARLAESTSIGDSGWHWTELKDAIVIGSSAGAERLRLHTTKRTANLRRATRTLQWQA